MAHIIGLTNALTDIIVPVTKEDLRKLNVREGTTNSFSKIDKSVVNDILVRQKPVYFTAGSTANVIFNCDKLGLETALMGTLGNDKVGRDYIKKLDKTNIFYVINKTKGQSGRVYVLVTPDGERTQLTAQGVAGEFSFSTNPLPIENDIFHTSGYEVASNPERALELIGEFTYGKKTLLSFDLASESMIRHARKPIEEIVQKLDILFTTEEEAKELTGKDPHDALEYFSKFVPITILKKGKNGSVVRKKNEQYEILAYPAKIINTCGAGDAYAAGFLFSQIKGFSLEECGHWGSFVASRICARKESHM
jgi:sugar/nucleoside kinase (ribokinase family)